VSSRCAGELRLNASCLRPCCGCESRLQASRASSALSPCGWDLSRAMAHGFSYLPSDVAADSQLSIKIYVRAPAGQRTPRMPKQGRLTGSEGSLETTQSPQELVISWPVAGGEPRSRRQPLHRLQPT
jgi:hypothetical protein